MRYVIAGGGEFGTHYVRKIRVAIARRALTLDGVIVVDRDPACAALAEIRRLSIAQLHVGDWTTFGDYVWLDRTQWQEDVWVPAPIAPHILSEWIQARLRRELRLTAVPAELPPLPPIPYARVLDDGRMLLSHAPGLCPVDCIEPEVCAITGERRFWEMRQTLATLTKPLGRPDIAMFFCRHHCDAGQYDVGGIRFRTIYEESDRIVAAVRSGDEQFGVATFSSCHGVLNLFRVERGDR